MKWASVSRHSLFLLCFFMYERSVFLFISFGGRPGGVRGSHHGPPADCARARLMVKRKGLYKISP